MHDYTTRFPLTETGNTQLLKTCYDYMGIFKQVIDSTSTAQLDDICQQYTGFFRFAKLMEMLAQGIAEGIIDAPRDH
ncbi:arylsulfatase regulator [Photorhabdus kayaii]|uniref:Arylsulfatase regulator n=2 Tax=Morganellaceae TaxID=1903414 RepID=A0AAW6BME2_9GAMM|nr:MULTISPECIES: arylsulfatase regulator [Photorhabdus]MCT8352675.1 arylsulfatase regulator [Photorhabdus kayaii]MDB6366803.1 arylsulfatase regulator [Photorhabdus bodei]MDB6374333.1 arylsulfatase regulator [Photorhabdus bodei]